MLIKKIILTASVACLLFPSIMVNLIPTAFPSPDNAPSYALEYASSPIRDGWYGPDKFKEIAYFSFYTFFKPGIEPDCIDIVKEPKCVDE